jgi:nucleolar pre-ribosomal-associated protein 1
MLNALHRLSFDWMFVQSSDADIANKQCRETMLECLFLRPPTRVQIEHAVCLIAHNIYSIMERESLVCHLLLLLSAIMQRALRVLSKEDGARLKECALLRAPSIHDLSMSGDLPYTVQEGNILSPTLRSFVNDLNSSVCVSRRFS